MSALFPILQHGYSPEDGVHGIPWAMIAKHESQAIRNHCGQSLYRLSERGGLGAAEAVAVLEDREYRDVWPLPPRSREDHEQLEAMAQKRLRELIAQWEGGAK